MTRSSSDLSVFFFFFHLLGSKEYFNGFLFNVTAQHGVGYFNWIAIVAAFKNCNFLLKEIE